MASLKARYLKYKTNTRTMQVLSESGREPLFCLLDKTGEYHAVNGTWSLPYVSKVEAFTMERVAEDGSITPITAVPPKCGKGDSIVGPVTLTIRNFISLDAENFRIERGVDLEKDELDPKRLKTCELAPGLKARINVASCIVGFEGMIAEDEKGKGVLMTFNTENLLQLLEDCPPLMAQADLFASDTKKFEGRS